MRRLSILLSTALLCVGLLGCHKGNSTAQIAATTLPVYEFTTYICQGTDICVTQLVTENVSCLHDYTLQVSQMRTIENAQLLIISGAGLETFLDDALHAGSHIIDASSGIALHCADEDNHSEHHMHSHESDPHIWLSPINAQTMSHNICNALIAEYPQYTKTFTENAKKLDEKFDSLNSYASEQLRDITRREIITFHDGFSYMAEAFDLKILHAIEEESGAEASAAELIEMVELVQEHQLKEIFVETNGSNSAASIISTETGAKIYTLDMAIAGSSYFDAMYHNIDILKEALQ